MLKNFECPFCHKKNIKILPNLPIQNLFDREFIKVENKLGQKEKDFLHKQQANKVLQRQIENLNIA